MKNNKYRTDIKLRVLNSQNKELETLKNKTKEDYGFCLNKNEIIKVAISELFKNLKSETDLRTLLKEYNYI